MTPTRQLVAGALAVLGAVVLLASGVDVYQDAVVQSEPLWTTLLENATGLALGVAVVLGARWTLVDASTLHVDRIAWWLPRAVAVGGFSIGWVLLYQSLQSRFKPAFVATDILALVALGSLAIATYDARQRAGTRELERQRDQFSALFENIPTPVIAVSSADDDLHIEMVNPAFESQFGLTERDLAGAAVDDVLRPADEEPEPADPSGAFAVGEDDDENWQKLEVTLETDDGQREFLRIAVPVDAGTTDQDEFVYYIDVTERNQRQEQLRVLSRTLRHDLRNKMTVVEGNAEALSARLDDDREQLSERIETASEELLGISRQTREVERIISGETTPEPRDLAPIVDAAVADARDKHPDATIDVDGDTTYTVSATDALETALGELLENAVEHADHDHPTVTVTATETLSGGYVDLAVADDGPGIPAHEHELLTGDTEASQLQHSSGLGLWVVQWIATNLGGDLQFDANTPRGSVVTLHIPLAAD